MMAMSQATAWQSLAVIAFFTGMVSEAGQPASSALVQDIVPKEQRVLAFAVQRFAVNLGWSFGPAVAGFLADYSFFWLFVVDAVTSALFGIIAWLFLPCGRRTPSESAGWGHAWSSIRQNRPFLMLFAACLCVSWIFRQTSTTFPLHFESSGLSMKWCGIILALNGIIICLCEIPLASATKLWPVRGMIGLGYILMGGCFLVFLGSSALWAFGLSMVIFTVGEMLAFSRQQAYAASLAHDDMRGRYSGFLSLSWSIGGIFASVGGLQLYQFSQSAAWIVAAGLGVVGAWLLSRSR